MKVRFGFVSNSSSSSFIIAVKEKLTISMLMDKFKIDKTSPLHIFAVSLAQRIDANVELVDIEEYVDDYGLSDTIKKVIENKLILYKGWASSDGDDYVEQALCSMSFDISQDDFIFEKEGGY